MTTDPRVEFLVNVLGRHSNSKWDHPIMGYETFSEHQKEFLREHAQEILDQLDEISYEDENTFPDDVINVGDQVSFRSDCPGWWATVGKVLEGPGNVDVYYLIEGFGKVQRGKKYYWWELEKLPVQAFRKFWTGDTVYAENVLLSIDGEEKHFDYIEGLVVDSFLSSTRNYLYTVRFKSAGADTYTLDETQIKGLE